MPIDRASTRRLDRRIERRKKRSVKNTGFDCCVTTASKVKSFPNRSTRSATEDSEQVCTLNRFSSVRRTYMCTYGHIYTRESTRYSSLSCDVQLQVRIRFREIIENNNNNNRTTKNETQGGWPACVCVRRRTTPRPTRVKVPPVAGDASPR